MTASGQNGGHVRLQLGAFVLHALAADEERSVAAHLAACPSCLAEAADLAEVRRVLDRLNGHSVARLLEAAVEPPAAAPAEPGAARPWAGDSHQDRHHTIRARAGHPRTSPPARPGAARRQWRRPSRSFLAAVLVALAVGVGIGAWLGARAPVDIRLAGAQTDSRSGVSVRVTVVGTPDGARVDAVADGLTVGDPYRLFVIGDRGESQVAAAWTAQDELHGVGGDVTIPIDRITAVTLFRSDAALVTVRLAAP